MTKAVEQVQGPRPSCKVPSKSSTAMEEMAGGMLQRIAESSSTVSAIRWPGPLRKRNAGMRQFRRL
ncbi:hypothetical protein P7H16_06555 [Paenibacillus larvae]|nr:hypothetical protein [Paenibacillus larvae]MDT2246684.1 hypothetical protein [Paenibacillus larvae]